MSRHPEGRHLTAPWVEELKEQGFPPDLADKLADVFLEILSRTHGGLEPKIPTRPGDRARWVATRSLRATMPAEEVAELLGYSRRSVDRIVAEALKRKIA